MAITGGVAGNVVPDQCVVTVNYRFAPDRTELEAQAKRLLRSVHVLASAYGWSESEILALSEARRDAYVELVQS